MSPRIPGLEMSHTMESFTDLGTPCRCFCSSKSVIKPFTYFLCSRLICCGLGLVTALFTWIGAPTVDKKYNANHPVALVLQTPMQQKPGKAWSGQAYRAPSQGFQASPARPEPGKYKAEDLRPGLPLAISAGPKPGKHGYTFQEDKQRWRGGGGWGEKGRKEKSCFPSLPFLPAPALRSTPLWSLSSHPSFFSYTSTSFPSRVNNPISLCQSSSLCLLPLICTCISNWFLVKLYFVVHVLHQSINHKEKL